MHASPKPPPPPQPPPNTGGHKPALTPTQKRLRWGMPSGKDHWTHKARESGQEASGNPRVFFDADELWNKFDEYCDFMEDTSFVERRTHVVKGKVEITEVPTHNPMTIVSWCAFAGISRQTWGMRWPEEREDLKEHIETINKLMKDQVLRGALSGCFNANLAARYLGLAERQELVNQQASTPQATPDEYHLAVHIHPDDEDALDLPRPMYSRAQLDAGIPFTPPTALQIPIEGTCEAAPSPAKMGSQASDAGSLTPIQTAESGEYRSSV